MAPPKLKKPLLEDPPTASSSEDEEVEDEEVEEQNPKTPSSDDDDDGEEEESNDDEEEDDESEKSDSKPATPPKLIPISSKPKKNVLKPSSSKSDPKTPSVDDEEEEDDGSEESDSEQATPPKLKPISSKPKNNVLKPYSSSKSDPKTPSVDDDEEEGDVSEESDSEPPPPKLKPILSKPKKTVSSVTPLKPSATAKKRPLESEKDSKRKKKKKKEEVDSTHHPEEESVRNTPNTLLFQRVWSDADEIVILKGMIECKKKGVDPLSDLSKFLESIKKSLQVKEVRQEQLREKIGRLRKKFINKSKRAKGDEDPVFPKPHEQLSYTLMKEIWGGGKSSNAAVSPVIRTKTTTLPDIAMMDLDGSNGSFHPCAQEWIYPRNNMNMEAGGSFSKQGLDLIGEAKRKYFDQKWRSLTAADLKLYLRRIDLVREEVIVVIDAHKSSDASEHE